MKRTIAIIACLVLPLVAGAKETALWTGTCRNVTHGVDGLLKVYFADDVGKIDGFISISGWLVGSGTITGTKTFQEIKFTSTDEEGVKIDWEGLIRGHEITGEYRVRPAPALGVGKEVGEFKLELANVQKDGVPESEESFRKLFLLGIEADLNSPVKLNNGSTVRGADALFLAVHPLGTGVSVHVNDVDIDWKPGASRRDAAEIRRYVLDYTLYWQALLRPQGWTRLRLAYNANLGQVTEHVVVKTTGVTNDEAADIAFGIGALLGQAAVEALVGD